MKTKIILLKIIKYIPLSSIKVLLLRKLFGYAIGKNVKIGKSIVNCEKVTIGDDVYIADNNVFSCKEILIGNSTKIHSGNVFQGNTSFSIGDNSRIINNHYFDLWNPIEIGDNSWVAGKSSQFWTHGSLHTKIGDKDLSIHIGSNVYIGSNCSFAPGTQIGAINLVGLGSVITKVFNEEKMVIAGNPAQIVKQNIDWRENW